jgi:hypothetical protein
MTPKKVADAIERAYEILKSRSSSWRDRETSGFEDVVMWESIVGSGALFGY